MIEDRAKIGDLELIIKGEEFEMKYKGRDAFESEEGLKAMLSLYKIGEIETENGKKFEFYGDVDDDFGKMERLGYSTNNVIATEGMVVKSYREVGNREPELLRLLGEIAPRVLGYGLYDGKYIQIITKRFNGEDVGKIIWENRQKYLRGEEWKEDMDEILFQIAQTVRKMHEILRKLGEERVKNEDVERWLENTISLAESAGLKLKNHSQLFSSQVDKEKIQIHGDMHFGQMLLHHGKIIITDFEGEPLYRKAEKLPPIRDIATLARALGYISRGEWDEWEKHGIEKIYEFYNSHIFTEREYYEWMFERALYEVNYEMKYRKENVDIPLKGAKRLGNLLGVLD